jgi:hypothetical protein
MDLVRLIPSAEAIPSPWGWFEALLLLTLALHLLFMNLAVGSAILAFAGRMGGARSGPGPELARELGHRAPTFLAFTINLGVAPLLFVQVVYGQMLYTSSVLMAGWWLSAIAALIIGYYGLYAHDARFDSAPGLSRLALAVSVALLLYTGFLLSTNMTLMLRPQAWLAYMDHPDGGLLNLSDPTMPARWMHTILAAPAVAGLYAALLGKKRNRPDWTAWGLRWFTRVTMIQVLAGALVLGTQPRDVLLALMGRDPLATAVLAAGVAVGLAALWAGLQGRPAAAAWLTVGAVVLMTVNRGQVRLLTLAPVFTPASLPVQAETSPLLLFVASLAVGLALVGYMLKLYAKSAAGR